MKSLLSRSLLAAALLCTPVMASDRTATDAAALIGRTERGLESLRGGDARDMPAMADAERDALLRATTAASHLDTLRAGEITDHDLLVVAVVVGIIVLLIVIF